MDDHVEHVTEALAVARERRGQLREAMVRLEEATAAPAPGRAKDWAVDVGAALEGIRGALADHVIATEGPRGLYEEIRTLQPRLERRIRDLMADHGALDTLADDAAAHLTAVADGGGDGEGDAVEGARDAVTTLLGRLARHRQRGLDFVYEAYTTDIGGGD